VLIVEDGGPGIPAAAIDRLFDRFERADRPGPDARHGLGIGLSVVRGLAEAMGGTVGAGRSSLGGLAITIKLRLAALPEERL
jgi:signal transduction histidine kinase